MRWLTGLVASTINNVPHFSQIGLGSATTVGQHREFQVQRGVNGEWHFLKPILLKIAVVSSPTGGPSETFGNMGKPGKQKALLFAGLRVCHGRQTPALQATQERSAKQVARRASRDGFTTCF